MFPSFVFLDVHVMLKQLGLQALGHIKELWLGSLPLARGKAQYKCNQCPAKHLQAGYNSGGEPSFLFKGYLRVLQG